MKKIALVIGATGLVGKELVKLLLADNRLEKVMVFTRRSMRISAKKLEEHLVDFDKSSSWSHLLKGDVMFSCMGTTKSQAGSEAAQYKIDYTYQYNFAAAGATNGVDTYVLVSSAGADPDSRIFYSRMKGELERDVKTLNFSSIYLIQPSLLVGDRDKSRFGEKAGFWVLKALNKLGLFKKYQPISGTTVAQAMVSAAIQSKPGIHIIALTDVFSLARG
ncbi:NAD(P)H-binding protein [Pedobacter sp. PWIIR3]